MKKEYNLSTMKSRKNPYASQLKQYTDNSNNTNSINTDKAVKACELNTGQPSPELATALQETWLFLKSSG